jgi:hypothetical protein
MRAARDTAERVSGTGGVGQNERVPVAWWISIPHPSSPAGDPPVVNHSISPLGATFKTMRSPLPVPRQHAKLVKLYSRSSAAVGNTIPREEARAPAVIWEELPQMAWSLCAWPVKKAPPLMGSTTLSQPAQKRSTRPSEGVGYSEAKRGGQGAVLVPGMSSCSPPPFIIHSASPVAASTRTANQSLIPIRLSSEAVPQTSGRP